MIQRFLVALELKWADGVFVLSFILEKLTVCAFLE